MLQLYNGNCIIRKKSGFRCLFCDFPIKIEKGGLCIQCKDERWKIPRINWLKTKALSLLVQKYIYYIE